MYYKILSKIAQVIMGQSPPSLTYNTTGEGLPFFQGKADFGEMYPAPRVYCSEPNRIAEPGDILITVRAPVGPTNINRERSCIGRGLAAIRVGNNLDRDYLLYFLRFYEPELAKTGTGSTFSAISRDDLETVKIPLPPLPEQQRIASLLTRADRLRRLRRHARELSGSLLQSVFLEMFGDPKTNPKGWEVYELGEVVKINPSGRLKVQAEQPTSFLPMTLVDPSNTFSDTLDIKRFDEVSTGYTYFEENDVLFAKITPCMENGNIVIAKNLLNGFGFGSTEFHVIRPNDTANSFWLYELVKRMEFRQEATRWFRGTAGQQRVPNDFLESFRVPVPPLALQEQFAGVVARHESLRRRQAESVRQAEGLFQSMLNEAFRG